MKFVRKHNSDEWKTTTSQSNEPLYQVHFGKTFSSVVHKISRSPSLFLSFRLFAFVLLLKFLMLGMSSLFLSTLKGRSPQRSSLNQFEHLKTKNLSTEVFMTYNTTAKGNLTLTHYSSDSAFLPDFRSSCFFPYFSRQT